VTTVPQPGIVEVFDFQIRAAGSAYIVMEALDGEIPAGPHRLLLARLQFDFTLLPPSATSTASTVNGQQRPSGLIATPPVKSLNCHRPCSPHYPSSDEGATSLPEARGSASTSASGSFERATSANME
jgi:hypothetical protein